MSRRARSSRASSTPTPTATRTTAARDSSPPDRRTPGRTSRSPCWTAWSSATRARAGSSSKGARSAPSTTPSRPACTRRRCAATAAAAPSCATPSRCARSAGNGGSTRCRTACSSPRPSSRRTTSSSACTSSTRPNVISSPTPATPSRPMPRTSPPGWSTPSSGARRARPQNGASNLLPSQTAQKPAVQFSSDGSLIKIEIAGSSSLSAADRNRVAAEFGTTLAQVSTITAIEITDGGSPVTVPAAGSAHAPSALTQLFSVVRGGATAQPVLRAGPTASTPDPACACAARSTTTGCCRSR